MAPLGYYLIHLLDLGILGAAFTATIIQTSRLPLMMFFMSLNKRMHEGLVTFFSEESIHNLFPQFKLGLQNLTLRASVSLYITVQMLLSGQIGDHSLAAQSALINMFFLAASVSVGLQNASAALIAHTVGSKKIQRARNYFTISLGLCLIFPIIFTLIFIFDTDTFSGRYSQDEFVQDLIFKCIPFVVAYMLLAFYNAQAQSAIRAFGLQD